MQVVVRLANATSECFTEQVREGAMLLAAGIQEVAGPDSLTGMRAVLQSLVDLPCDDGEEGMTICTILIKQLTSQVQGLSEAPQNGHNAIPALSLNSLVDTQIAGNHPQWVSQALFILSNLVHHQTPSVDTARMIPKMRMRTWGILC